MITTQKLMELIATRRSIRQFTSEPVPDEMLERVCEAAIWAPTGSNQQEIRLYPTTDPADIGALRAAKPHIKNPQAAILVYADVSSEYYHDLSQRPHKAGLPFMDVGAACQNMLLVAHSLGLGACWLNVSPHMVSALPVFKRLRVKPNMRLVAGLFLGYPARVPELASARHCGRRVQREHLDSYLLDMPPVSRVVHVHSIRRDHANLGAQAMSAGLRGALHSVLGDVPFGLIDVLDDPHLSPYKGTLSHVTEMEPHDALKLFKAEVKRAGGAATRARAIRDVPFAWLCNPLGQLNRFARRLVDGSPRDRAFSVLSDPLFSTRQDSTLIPEYPVGCVTRNGEIRVPDKTFWLRNEDRLAYRAGRVFPSLYESATPLRAAAALRLLNWAQVVILDANGHVADLFYKGALRALFNLALAKSLGAAVYAVDVTVAVQNPALSALVKYVFNSIDGVVLREPMSKGILLDIGVKQEKIRVGADCAILANQSDEARAQRLAEEFAVDERSVGLVLRGDMSPAIDLWVDVVRRIRERFHRDVVFLSSCERQDLKFGQALGQRTGIKVIHGLNDFAVFVPFVRRLEVLVTQRYHPIYFSIMAGVPFVPLLGNTSKARGLLQHFDYPCKVLDLESATDPTEVVISALDKVLLNADDIRLRLPGIRAHLERLAWTNVEMLRREKAG